MLFLCRHGSSCSRLSDCTYLHTHVYIHPHTYTRIYIHTHPYNSVLTLLLMCRHGSSCSSRGNLCVHAYFHFQFFTLDLDFTFDGLQFSRGVDCDGAKTSAQQAHMQSRRWNFTLKKCTDYMCACIYIYDVYMYLYM